MENIKKKWRVLICCTGSVATIKLKQLIEDILKHNTEVRVVVTEHAEHFFDPNDLPSGVVMYRDADEWALWKSRGDPVLHIDLGKWADVLILAPLDANTLAKVSQVNLFTLYNIILNVREHISKFIDYVAGYL